VLIFNDYFLVLVVDVFSCLTTLVCAVTLVFVVTTMLDTFSCLTALVCAVALAFGLALVVISAPKAIGG
jgi:hypothetical protein